MILQYKGFKNNWCYIEAETIVWANVWVGKETRDYRKDGIRWKHLQKTLEECQNEEQKSSVSLHYVQEMHNSVNKLIKEETNCYDDIVYHIDGKFDDMENVCVVTLMDKNMANPCTYVFDKPVYLLNNHGQTVQRLS